MAEGPRVPLPTPSHPHFRSSIQFRPTAPAPIHAFKITQLETALRVGTLQLLAAPPPRGTQEFAPSPSAGKPEVGTQIPQAYCVPAWCGRWGWAGISYPSAPPEGPSGGRLACFAGDWLGKPSVTRNLAGPKSHLPSLLPTTPWLLTPPCPLAPGSQWQPSQGTRMKSPTPGLGGSGSFIRKLPTARQALLRILCRLHQP